MSYLLAAIFDPEAWRAVPFGFWTVWAFILGAMTGSFLNVCIHRMPRELSLIHPPSHCPHCGNRIRWRHNIPILSWLVLGGRCAYCRAAIPIRYLLVEALTGAVFSALWVQHGHAGVWVALAFAVFSAGLIAATFIDIGHLIIPDSITLGGTAVGIALAAVVPGIHGEAYTWPSLKAALIGAATGAGVVLGILELGKLLLGRQRFQIPEDAPLVFTEDSIHLPDRVLAYEEVFYRTSDTLTFHAARLELIDRSYWNATVRLRLRAGVLKIGDEELDPATVPWMAAITDQVTVPREAMGLGDVKFMAAIGAFTGWPGVVFALLGSSVAALVISLVLTLIGRREWSARIPYGPYLAAAALAWVLGAREWFLPWLLPPGLG